MLQCSKHVLTRPHLLDHFIRSQFIDVLADVQEEEYTKAERNEALWYVVKLAQLRHENPANTLQDILEN